MQRIVPEAQHCLSDWRDSLFWQIQEISLAQTTACGLVIEFDPWDVTRGHFSLIDILLSLKHGGPQTRKSRVGTLNPRKVTQKSHMTFGGEMWLNNWLCYKEGYEVAKVFEVGELRSPRQEIEEEEKAEMANTLRKEGSNRMRMSIQNLDAKMKDFQL
jgi:hypothetical protein